MSTNNISRIFIVLLVLVVAMVTVSFVNHSAASAVADRSYDTIEQLRIKAAAFVADTSYDAIERLRLSAPATSNASASGYDQVEAVRLHRSLGTLQAYLDQRHGEQTTGVNAAKAYLDYRRSEWSGK